MATKVEICNIALSRIGNNQLIESLDEQSQEARQCKLIFDATFEKVLTDFDWPFALSYRSLSLIEETPNDDWAFSYRYPTDCLKIRRIVTGNRKDKQATKIEYETAIDNGVRVIFTDQEEAKVRYTVRIDDPTLWTAGFVSAFAWRLAYEIAMPLAEEPSRRDAALRGYMMEISEAASAAANESEQGAEPETDLISCRSN